jgi:hypothetical protein
MKGDTDAERIILVELCLFAGCNDEDEEDTKLQPRHPGNATMTLAPGRMR